MPASHGCAASSATLARCRIASKRSAARAICSTGPGGTDPMASSGTAIHHAGHFRLFLRYCLGFVLAYLILIGSGLYLWAALTEQGEDQQIRTQLQGIHHLLQARYADTPQAQWPQLTRLLQTQFAYPVRVIPMAEAPHTLYPQSLQHLEQGGLVVTDDAHFSYQRLPGSSEVLVLGDFSKPDKADVAWYDSPSVDTLVMVGIFVIAIALPLYFLVYRLWRDVYALGHMALAIQQGDLAVGAPAVGTHLVRPLREALSRMATQLQDVMEGQRILSQAVAHETRTPLARMRFALAMMQVGDEDPEGTELLEGLKADVTRLEQLASAGVTYAQFGRSLRISTQRLEVAEVFDALDQRLPPGGRVRRLRFLPSHQRTLVANRDALLLALGNLIGNACRHAASEVVVSASTVEQWVVIAVDDDGPGVAPADRERIFQPYVQLQRHPDGFGLGLALVHIIAIKHGGRADVCDSVLGGARFRLLLPDA
ncbi:ATP-binding protein [Stenotrophomonas rhizophila]|uniref:ATP-binding protein n=1 Tax=Stenotrophomonas rhizophila TaxID=216778 RepID=UPI000EAB5F6E|nr:ATP-binding protein [Stenotrophomonas rhizophila]